MTIFYIHTLGVPQMSFCCSEMINGVVWCMRDCCWKILMICGWKLFSHANRGGYSCFNFCSANTISLYHFLITVRGAPLQASRIKNLLEKTVCSWYFVYCHQVLEIREGRARVIRSKGDTYRELQVVDYT